MSTSMLDALADEAKTVTDLGIAASRLAIEAVQRSRHLHLQIERLAQDERAKEIQDPPGTSTAVQQSGAVNQGSDASAPGGAAARSNAEFEQAVTEAVSGERGDEPRKDPETAPDIQPTLSSRILDLYSDTNLSPREIGRDLGAGATVVNEAIRLGRRNGDRRAAQGDHRRDIGTEVALATRAGRARPQPSDPVAAATVPTPEPVLEAPQDGEICRIDLNTCLVTHGEETVQLARHEMRLVLALNSGDPVGVEPVMAALKVLTYRSVDRELNKVNPRLATIGLHIEEGDGRLFKLVVQR